ncbi:CRISPR-associated endonuclease Cas2 [Flavihumibacter profundi]|uniref:CRISPR-associated endonuclease Cas2 n=1 Tax=Flavihumibacter profundi TaxID=2716883 RepID=UPI001CC35CA3|nr:CRISPR-associated endonuclease Cas2 [Flavihumibacter profundi]MBZ5857567.1 CRISPR-associated endonuclease Cas2 [Flavihumibacter profundi]
MAKPKTYHELLLALKKAGMNRSAALSEKKILTDKDELLPLSERVEKIISLLKKASMTPAHNTLGFIMYDIEDNKVRNHIAKYLERLGYVRIQKSIFFGNTNRKIHEDVHQALKEINDLYENKDSIVFLPVSSDDISKLRLIGKNIEFQVMMGSKNVLFI